MSLLLSDCQNGSSGQELSCPLSDLKMSELIVEERSFQFENEIYPGTTALLSDWNLFAIKVSEPDEQPASRKVFYIPGGPRVPPISLGLIKQLTRLYDDGSTEIIILSHSGNQLSILNGSERIERYGIDSVNCDSAVAERFIRQQKNIDDDIEIILHGNSYGSLLTLDLASDLGEVIDRVIVQAPWVFPASINDMLNNRSPVFVRGPDGIELIERESMEQDMRLLYERYLRISARASGKSVGERQIESIRKRACKAIGQPVLFLIGEYEDRSDVEKTINYSQCFQGGATIVEAERAPHGSELAVASVRDQVRAFLNNESSSAN